MGLDTLDGLHDGRKISNCVCMIAIPIQKVYKFRLYYGVVLDNKNFVFHSTTSLRNYYITSMQHLVYRKHETKYYQNIKLHFVQIISPEM